MGADTSISTQLKEWGTSRAVRIPKPLCGGPGISIGSQLTIEYRSNSAGGSLAPWPALGRHRSYSNAPYRSMDELSEGYEGTYVPHAGDWGDDVGAEVLSPAR